MTTKHKKRSIGVSIFAWIFISYSITTFISMFLLRSRLSEYETKHFILPESYYYVVQSHSAIEFIICLITGVGLLRLLSWARILAFFQTCYYFVYCTVFFFVYTSNYTIPYFRATGRSAFLLYSTIPNSIIWLLFTVYFFNRASVKKQFIKNR
jgi:hypothetical protein